MKGPCMHFRAPLLALALAATALPAGGWAQTTGTEAPATAAPSERAQRAAQDIVLGSEDAPLTIVEYASFTCSHCGAFHRDVFPTLKAEYIDTGKVRFIQRDVYFDAVGLWAGILARCEPEKFYAVGGMVMDEQADWLKPDSSGEALADSLRKIGLRAGMDADAIQACWDDRSFVEALVGAYQTNAEADKIDATPSFIIGGEKVPNQSWDSMKTLIDAKLAEAEGAKE